MENKYNDLILSLIKEHPKYVGYEAILEDLFDDVYARSKVVLATVTNEDVLVSYLKKVINTSIVAVPKKLNFNVRARHRIISTLPEPVLKKEDIKVDEKTVEQKIESESVQEVVVKEEVVPEPVFEDILTIEEEVVPTAEVELEEVKSDEVILEEEVIKTASEQLDVVEEDSIDLNLDDEIETTDNFSEELILVEEDPIVSVDKNLVDMMINGVSNNSINESDSNTEQDFDSEVFEPEIDSLETELVVEEESLDLAEENSEPEVLLTEEESVSLNFDNELEEDEVVDKPDSSNTETTDTFETLETLETLDPVETLETVDVFDSFESQEDDSMLLETEEFVEVEETLSVEEGGLDLIDEVEVIEEQDSLVALDTIETTESLEISESLDALEVVEALETFDTDEDDSMLLETEESLEESSFDIVEEESESDVLLAEDEKDSFESTISFECFSFEPDVVEVDYDLILDELKVIAKKHPQKKIFEICELKYKKDLSVNEIAEKLGFTKDDVVDILNDIIDVVKD